MVTHSAWKANPKETLQELGSPKRREQHMAMMQELLEKMRDLRLGFCLRVFLGCLKKEVPR